MNHLPTSILNLLGFTTSGGGRGKREASDGEEEEGGDMTSMVRRLVMDQHRTMFYTVTLSPQTQQHKNIAQAKIIAPSLKVKSRPHK